MFKLEFETRNAAFDDENGGDANDEIARILRSVAMKVEEGREKGRIMDANGNAVGTWECTKD